MVNKKTITGLVVVAVLVGGVFLLFRSKALSVIGTGDLTTDENKLLAFQADLDSFAGDEVVMTELDQTFSDMAEAFAGASISQEANQLDASQSLVLFYGDNAQSQEFDLTFNEVSQ